MTPQDVDHVSESSRSPQGEVSVHKTRKVDTFFNLPSSFRFYCGNSTSNMYIVLIAIFSIVYGDLQDWYNEFDYNTFMGGSDEKYQVFWNEDQDACTLEVGLAVQTDSWIAFGISENGVGMQQSDIVIAWITDQEEIIIQNRYGQGTFTPTLFEDQSRIQLIEGWKDDTNGTITTFIRFTRELFPEFDDNAISVKIGTTKVIWAWGQQGELSINDAPGYHGLCPDQEDPDRLGCRGIESMNLIQGESTEIPLPQDAEEHVVYLPNVPVPDAETTYYCSLHELPPC